MQNEKRNHNYKKDANVVVFGREIIKNDAFYLKILHGFFWGGGFISWRRIVS